MTRPRQPRYRILAACIAWALAAFIVFATLGPQSGRPHMGPAQLERFGAYFVTAAAFVIAYPRRFGLIAFSAVVAAVALELGQLLVPGRDAGASDAAAKAVGGFLGAMVCAGVGEIWRRTQKRSIS
jgi:VanZ family protein